MFFYMLWSKICCKRLDLSVFLVTVVVMVLCFK